MNLLYMSDRWRYKRKTAGEVVIMRVERSRGKKFSALERKTVRAVIFFMGIDSGWVEWFV